MADVIRLTSGNLLAGRWMDADENGTPVQFTFRPTGRTFDVAGIDTSDGERLVISDVRWDGRILSFTSLVPSTSHVVTYEFEVTAPSEVAVRYTLTERWTRVTP
jgi:hypothetical protein